MGGEVNVDRAHALAVLMTCTISIGIGVIFFQVVNVLVVIRNMGVVGVLFTVSLVVLLFCFLSVEILANRNGASDMAREMTLFPSDSSEVVAGRYDKKIEVLECKIQRVYSRYRWCGVHKVNHFNASECAVEPCPHATFYFASTKYISKNQFLKDEVEVQNLKRRIESTQEVQTKLVGSVSDAFKKADDLADYKYSTREATHRNIGTYIYLVFFPFLFIVNAFYSYEFEKVFGYDKRVNGGSGRSSSPTPVAEDWEDADEDEGGHGSGSEPVFRGGDASESDENEEMELPKTLFADENEELYPAENLVKNPENLENSTSADERGAAKKARKKRGKYKTKTQEKIVKAVAEMREEGFSDEGLSMAKLSTRIAARAGVDASTVRRTYLDIYGSPFSEG